LTERGVGSTIKIAKAKTTKTSAVFFKAVALLTVIFMRSSAGGPLGSKTFCLRNTRRMRTLTQLQQNRKVIQDFTLTALAGISGLYARLIYVASLRNLSSGRYEHAGLAALYPGDDGTPVVNLTQETIAQLAGASRATVNQILRDEERRGAIELLRGKTRILDVGALEKRAR
jgi:CRP-like cAMP-binding protein